MVGAGVLRECLHDAGVEQVITLGRAPTGVVNPKVQEIVRADLLALDDIEPRLTGLDACFFCLGASAAGLTEARYTKISYDLTMGVAERLARLDPGLTFVYVSGMGTDSTEHGRVMWARVKGRTENALLRLPFKAFMFRPGIIVPVHGESSRTPGYRWMYRIMKPVLPLIRRLFPTRVTTTEQMGRAMLRVAREGYPSPVLEAADITRL